MIKLKRFTLIVSALCISSAAVFADLVVIDEGLNNAGINSAIGMSGKAVNFVMGAGDDYKLTSVVLGIGNINAGATPIVRLWSDDGTGAPIGSVLETLSNPGTLVTGANTFTSSGTTLEASRTYWITVENENTTTFEWLGNNAD
ncbi:MAG TPA: choice-of-anchor R domain-containing protein, partial [Opitutales bacterium]|nr:choice-of-anchor R domain-containing protein [Opitutales bacterium]